MILLIGGAGYIGSHINKLLNKSGYKTLIYDNLSQGHKESVKWGELIVGDLENIGKLREIFKTYEIEAVMHFAAFSNIGETASNPQKYYINNVSNTLNLLKIMGEFSCKKFIFSSTCSIYGEPQYLPIDEKHPQNPLNSYGKSKLFIEKILEDYSKAYDLKYVSLRYFNAAGADMDCEIGESHNPETHLIPLIFDAATKKREDIKVFGDNYNTKDGSAIRDYIHVDDLAQAHFLALEYLQERDESNTFNLGNGEGFSVFEVIEMVKKITNKDFKVTTTKRREGDAAKLVGDSKKAKEILLWEPQNSSLETIIKTAWNWYLNKKY